VSLREDRKREKRDRILTAARELFDAHGFHGTSTRAIAERAGVGTGTVFVYFPDKRDLLLRLFYDTIEPAFAEALATMPDADVVDRLVHVCCAFLSAYAPRPRLAREFVKQLLFLEGDARDEYAALNARFFAFVVAELARGQRTLREGVDPMDAGRAVFAWYGLVIVEWLGGDRPVVADGAARLRRGFTLVLDGLVTPS